MIGRGESNKGGQTKSNLHLTTGLTETNLEETTVGTVGTVGIVETVVIIEGLKRSNSQVSEIGFTQEKILNSIRAQDLIEMSLQMPIMIMLRSIKRIKNTSSTKSISSSHGLLKGMTLVKFIIGK
jgi:CheY-like chemotaxis protein